MISRPLSPTLALNLSAQMGIRQKKVQKKKEQDPAKGVAFDATTGEPRFNNQEPKTFPFLCSSIQMMSYRKRCVLDFCDATQVCLTWKKARCAENFLQEEPSIEELLSPMQEKALMAHSGLDLDDWERFVLPQVPPYIKVKPSGDISAVEVSFNPSYPHKVTYMDLYLVWPWSDVVDTRKNLEIHTNISLRSLLACGSPCLVLMFPVTAFKTNLFGDLTYTDFLFSDEQKTRITKRPHVECLKKSYPKIEASGANVPDKEAPCLFILDVFEDLEHKAIANSFRSLGIDKR